MRILRFPFGVLWAVGLLLVIASPAIYQKRLTQQTVQSLDRKLRVPAWRDQFEKDYKPAFDRLHKDPDSTMEGENALGSLLKQRFPDMSRFHFSRRGDSYSARIYFGRACIAYTGGDPGQQKDFVSSSLNVAATYPRFQILWYEWD